MDILITGVCGFIGYHTARAYLSRGYRVIGIDDLSADSDGSIACGQRLELLLKVRGFEFNLSDISETQRFDYFLEGKTPDRCIHLAAKAGVQGCNTRPKQYVDTNMRGFDAVAAWCSERKIPLIYASSASVYGNVGDSIMHENMRPLPLNLYGMSKYYNELSAAKFADRDELDSVGLRFFNVYGPLGRPDSLFMKLLNSRPDNPVMIYGNGEMQRDWTHVSDIVAGIMQAAEHRRRGAFVFNLGAGNPHTINEALRFFEDAKASISYHRVGDVSGDEIMRCYSDNAKARLSFGYAPKVELQDGIASLVEWFNSTRQ